MYRDPLARPIGFLCHLGSWSCLFQIRNEAVHAAAVTSIASTIWNIAHTSTKNAIILIRINLPTLASKLLFFPVFVRNDV